MNKVLTNLGKYRKNDFLFLIENLKRNLDYLENSFEVFKQGNSLISHFIKEEIGKWVEKDMVFIISTGRTGTKWFESFFNKTFQNVLALHEPDPSFLYLGKDFMKDNISLEQTKKRFLVGREHILYRMIKNNSKIYIESNNRLFSLIRVLRNLFPNAKIIHIIRDCRDFILSLHKKNIKDNEFTGLPFRANEFVDDEYYEEWKDFAIQEKIAWYWNMVNRKIIEDTSGFDDLLTVKFENIFNEYKNHEGLKKIINFCDVKNDKMNFDDYKDLLTRKKNASSRYLLPPWQDWDEDIKRNVLRISGDLMKDFGYIS